MFSTAMFNKYTPYKKRPIILTGTANEAKFC